MVLSGGGNAVFTISLYEVKWKTNQMNDTFGIRMECLVAPQKFEKKTTDFVKVQVNDKNRVVFSSDNVYEFNIQYGGNDDQVVDWSELDNEIVLHVVSKSVPKGSLASLKIPLRNFIGTDKQGGRQNKKEWKLKWKQFTTKSKTKSPFSVNLSCAMVLPIAKAAAIQVFENDGTSNIEPIKDLDPPLAVNPVEIVSLPSKSEELVPVKELEILSSEKVSDSQPPSCNAIREATIIENENSLDDDFLEEANIDNEASKVALANENTCMNEHDSPSSEVQVTQLQPVENSTIVPESTTLNLNTSHESEKVTPPHEVPQATVVAAEHSINSAQDSTKVSPVHIHDDIESKELLETRTFELCKPRDVQTDNTAQASIPAKHKLKVSLAMKDMESSQQPKVLSPPTMFKTKLDTYYKYEDMYPVVYEKIVSPMNSCRVESPPKPYPKRKTIKAIRLKQDTLNQDSGKVEVLALELTQLKLHHHRLESQYARLQKAHEEAVLLLNQNVQIVETLKATDEQHRSNVSKLNKSIQSMTHTIDELEVSNQSLRIELSTLQATHAIQLEHTRDLETENPTLTQNLFQTESKCKQLLDKVHILESKLTQSQNEHMVSDKNFQQVKSQFRLSSKCHASELASTVQKLNHQNKTKVRNAIHQEKAKWNREHNIKVNQVCVQLNKKLQESNSKLNQVHAENRALQSSLNSQTLRNQTSIQTPSQDTTSTHKFQLKQKQKQINTHKNEIKTLKLLLEENTKTNADEQYASESKYKKLQTRIVQLEKQTQQNSTTDYHSMYIEAHQKIVQHEKQMLDIRQLHRKEIESMTRWYQTQISTSIPCVL